MHDNTLILNADYSPLRVVGWTVGIEILYDRKATLVEQSPGRWVRSPSVVYPWPSVVVLRRYSHTKGRLKFSGRSLMARDLYRCCYCGVAPKLADGKPNLRGLSIDHVIPKSQARNYEVYATWLRRWVPQTCWLNCVTACRQCNTRKANNRPDQAGMQLRILPHEPTRDDTARMAIARVRNIPGEWVSYLPPHWLGPLGLSTVQSAVQEQ